MEIFIITITILFKILMWIVIGLFKIGFWLFLATLIVWIISEAVKPQNKGKKPKDWIAGEYTVETKKKEEFDIWEEYRKKSKYKPKKTDYDPAVWKERNHEAKQYRSGYQEQPFKKQEPVAPEQPKPIVWDKAFLMSIEWKLFEDVCVEYLKTRKCDARVTNLGKDDGIDLKVFNPEGGLMFIGQCKAWNRPIDVKEIRELYGIMAAENVTDGFYITTSTFTKVAKEFKQGKRILLIDGDECVKRFNNLDEESKARINKLVNDDDFAIPTCVSCGVKMVKRISQKPYNKGQEFWGCKNYPSCKKILKMRKNLNF